jgi:NAD(P)-dependent dehydrogenase (short-subunit alcohol dehydrogenase family)
MSTVQSPKSVPAQHQQVHPGKETEMSPRPIYDNGKPGCDKLNGKVAIITGGDSGIGRAVAVSFAKEGANVVIAYLNEHDDAKETARVVKSYGKEPLLIAADISVEANCKGIVEETIARFGRIDILVNNAAVQYESEQIEDITSEQLRHTFEVNIFSQFYLSKYTVPYLKKGSSIINTASITAYKGNESLMDYAATKGAIVAFTRSLAQSLADQEIRVNGVAPGPVWTPLIPSSFSADKVKDFGKDTPIGRVAQPFEIAPCYVFLASDDAVFLTGQVLHPNGGTVVNA